MPLTWAEWTKAGFFAGVGFFAASIAATVIVLLLLGAMGLAGLSAWQSQSSPPVPLRGQAPAQHRGWGG